MLMEVETGCRVALGLLVVGLALVGIPARWRADRVGGRVSRAADPGWFWLLMVVVGPPVPLVGGAFLLEPRWVAALAFPAPAWVRLLGVPLGVGGLLLFAWMFRHLGLNVTSTSMPRASASLVTTGPYRWVRHPMYTAAMILAIAATLLTANWMVAVGGAAAWSLLAVRSVLEEERLVEKFGEAYRDYQRRTGRFWPRVTR
jgi:protein-S-isoprenylcysteine O-methyltransferase Ste14